MSQTEEIYDEATDGLPLDLHPTELVFETPGAFLENLAFRPDGTLFFTDLIGGRIFAWNEAEGGRVFAEPGLYPMSLELDVDGSWYIAGHGGSSAMADDLIHAQKIHRMSADGKVEPFVDLPDALLLNGMMRLSPGIFLFADSYADTIWQLDVATREVTPWFRDRCLGQPLPITKQPAANGIKRWRNQIVVSNSVYRTFVYIDINADGSAGNFTVRESGISVDDFVILESGTLLISTHRQPVVRLKPDGAAHVIANSDAVRGNTSLAMGVTERDKHMLYSVGDGGLWFGDAKMAGVSRIDLSAGDTLAP